MFVKAGFAQAARPSRCVAQSGTLRRPAAIMAGLTACAVLVRLPFLSDAGSDECFYLVVARQWLEGMPPYANAFDVKPPLLFALLAVAEALFGPTLLAAKALIIATVSATACALYLFGRRFLGELSGVAAALFYIVASLTLGGTFSPAELIMAPFTAFGMLAGFAAITRLRPPMLLVALAGVLLGAAACVKQTVIFEALPLAAFLVFQRPPGDGLKALTSLAAGCLVVPAGFALLFFAEGHFGALFKDVVLSAAGRMDTGYVPWSEAVTRFAIELMLVAAPRHPGGVGLGLPQGISRAAISSSRRLPRSLDGRRACRCAPGASDVRLLHASGASSLMPLVGRVPGAWDCVLPGEKGARARADGGICERHDFFCDSGMVLVLQHCRWQIRRSGRDRNAKRRSSRGGSHLRSRPRFERLSRVRGKSAGACLSPASTALRFRVRRGGDRF